jgi:hypothetical protein
MATHLEEVAAELAYHFEHASDWIRTVKYLRLAAETAEQRYAHRETIALLLRAVDLVSRLPEEERPGAEMQILRSWQPFMLPSSILAAPKFMSGWQRRHLITG